MSASGAALSFGVATAEETAVAAQGRLWWRALRFWIFRWRRTWRASLAGNFVYPLVYLAAMGVGLGHLVNHHLAGTAHNAIGGVGYLSFVTPGILAGSMMTIGLQEATYPVMGALRWDRAYLSQLASPLTVRDIARGHLLFLALRAMIASSVFVAIAAGFGALHSLEAILAVPVSVLVALAFGAPIAAFAVTQETDSSFAVIQRLGIVPLFLFSGSFFPISELPAVLRALAIATPLYHGVALVRSCTLGTLLHEGNAAHLAYLVVLAAIGVVVAQVTYRRRLSQ